jgi:sulfonate transport system substrate-binding protein
VVTGAFDHTIQMQAKSQSIVAVVLLGRYPGFALALRKDKAANYKTAKDLKGMKIGVTAPGSSTHFMALHMMTQAGLKPDDASFIGVGAGSTVVAAVKHGEVDGVVNVDPMINLLDRDGEIKIVADTRTLEGTKKVYGGPYPAAVLYASSAFVEKNPGTTQALVNAFVRGLKWVHGHSPEEIAKMMPEEYALGDKALYLQSIKTNLPAYSPDGKFSKEGAETALNVLKAFDPGVQKAAIDLSKTYTDKFVDAANAGH